MKFIFLVVVMAVVFAACGGAGGGAGGAAPAGGDAGAAPAGDQADAPAGATDVSFHTFNNLHIQFYEEAVATWNEMHPDRAINLHSEAYAFEDAHNMLLIALHAGEGAADLVDIEISRFANFVAGDYRGLIPLNRVVEPELPYMVYARFANYAVDGNYYGICFHVGATLVFYNMDIINEAGVDIDAIVTWEDWRQAGFQVLERTGVPMTAYETTDIFSFYPFMNQQGSDVFDANGNVILDNEINIRTLEWLLENIHLGLAVRAPGGNFHSEEFYAFMGAGGVASIVMPAWYMGRFTDYMPDLAGRIEIRPLPIFNPGDNRSAGMGGTGTGITIQAENTDLIMDFLGWARLSYEQNIRIWEIMGFDPIRWDVWYSPAMQEPNRFTEYFANDIFGTLVGIIEDFNPINVTADFPEAMILMRSVIMPNALEMETMTPEEVLRQVADELRARQ